MENNLTRMKKLLLDAPFPHLVQKRRVVDARFRELKTTTSRIFIVNSWTLFIFFSPIKRFTNAPYQINYLFSVPDP
jgi:hypothetical protein